MRRIPFRFPARDGYALEGDLFLPSEPEPTAAALVAPAMGVPRRYYSPFAGYLARRGIAALTVDPRGVGGSLRGPLRGFEASLHGWAELDLAGALDALAARLPHAPLLWVGHSVGGQLLGLLEEPRLAGALLVAAQSGHWRLWPGLARAGMAALWWIGVPALVSSFGYLPLSRLGQGEDVPAGVAREWAAWGRHREYILSYARPRGGLGFARFGGPLRSYAIADDRYAPVPSVRALASAYAAARVEVRVLRAADVGARSIGHFGFFRPAFEATLWAEAADWLHAAARTASPRSAPPPAVA